MRVKGVVNEETGLKDFVVTYNGRTHVCKRSGQKFTWNGHRGTLKAMKGAIAEYYETAAEQEEEAVADASKGSTWHTDAAALLVLHMHGAVLEHDWVHHCLDAHGYIKEDGEVDVVAALTAVNNIYNKGRE